MAIKLYDYQQEVLDEVESEFMFGDSNRILLDMPMSSGKSFTACKLAIESGYKTIISLSYSALVDQFVDSMKALNFNDFTVIKANHDIEFNHEARIIISMENTMHARLNQYKEYIMDFDLVIADECFTGDTEVLTEKGFMKFKNLKNELIAQVDYKNNNGINFVKPIRKIKKYYSGGMIELNSGRNNKILMTKNHDVIVDNKKISAIEATKSKYYSKKIKTSGYSTYIDYNDELSAYEKLCIAYQADGYISNKYNGITNNINHIGDALVKKIGFEPKNGYCSIQFQFSKERKIKSFINDFKNFKIIENKYVKKKNNVKAKRRFLVQNVDITRISKNLKDIFDITKISKNKAISIIEYMMIWDGYIQSSSSRYYSSTNEENVNFVQELAIIAGYTSHKSIQKDNRKETYNDIYKIFIKTDTNSISCSNRFKKSKEYNGLVYCVEVPKGSIIVRSNSRMGKPIIIGNCHARIYGNRLREILNEVDPDYIIGMSGTPYTAYGSRLKTFQRTIRTITTKELISRGKITPIQYLVNPEIFKYKRNYKSLSEFSEEDLSLYLTDKYTNMIIDDFMNNHIFEPQSTKSIWFCNSVASAKKYAEKLREAGYMAIAYHGKMNKDYEKKVMSSFQDNEYVDLTTEVNLFNYDKLKKHRVMGLVSVAKLSVGFSVEDINVGVYTYPTNSITKWYQSVARIARKHPNKDIAYLMDYGRNLELFGTTEDIYEPPQEDTEYKEGEYVKSNEKQAIEDQVSMQNLDCICKDKLSIVTRDIYNTKVKRIIEDTRPMSEMTIDEKLDKFILLEDDLFELTLLYLSIFRDTWGDPYTYMKYNKKTNKEEEKEVANYYKESTIKWIANHWINTIEKNNMNFNEMVQTFKNVAKKNIKNKKNVYAIRFFIDYIVNNELIGKIEENTECPIAMLHFYIDYANKRAFCSEYELENHNYDKIELNDFLDLNNGKTKLDLVPMKLEPQEQYEYNPEFIEYIDDNSEEIPF